MWHDPSAGTMIATLIFLFLQIGVRMQQSTEGPPTSLPAEQAPSAAEPPLASAASSLACPGSIA